MALRRVISRHDRLKERWAERSCCARPRWNKSRVRSLVVGLLAGRFKLTFKKLTFKLLVLGKIHASENNGAK